ncbi:MAG: TonB-dependent receptor [Proteobacteria bacterium]|nr:TonB-dependent receptor [Pseudomonadota bacterium]
MSVLRATARLLAPIVSLCATTTLHSQVSEQAGDVLSTIVITAQHLNEERARIDTQTGASTYSFSAGDIRSSPGGDNVQLNQVMLQVPDAAQDSFGQLHIRGDHNGLQFRLNGVILPDGISFFGQTLPPRLISSVKVITGSLPAQFGLRSAGIIDITTKGGALQPGGEISLYGGSHGSIQPSFGYGGHGGADTWYLTGDYIANALGIESPDGRSTPLHDHTHQYHAFGYFEHLFSDTDRLSLIAGTSVTRFQIPNLHGVHAADVGPGLTVEGVADFLSQELDQNQREVTTFASAALQHSSGALSVRSSLLYRFSSLRFDPGAPLGNLLFNGIAPWASKSDAAWALQSDAAWTLSSTHTLRGGMYLQTDHLDSRTLSGVLPTDDAGVQTSDLPLYITDDGTRSQWIESAYLQDEWRLAHAVTINYGLRFDHFEAFSSGSQLSPRANLVWQPWSRTTVHAGYSRYFSPPPFELVGGTTIGKFVNTTAAPAVRQADAVLPERSNYYDLGIEQLLGEHGTVGIDSYYKQSSHLIDEGQFGAPIIQTPFNYRYGQVYGVEFTGSYNTAHVQLYANLALQRAIGKQIESSQFNFSAKDIAWLADHYIHLDHEQQITASAGAAWLWQGTRISGDLLMGSGLRAEQILADGSTIPNGAHLPYYRQVNLGVSHAFDAEGIAGLTLRLDVINAFDTVYQIRNGTGVGVGAPQYGPRRGVFAGASWEF